VVVEEVGDYTGFGEVISDLEFFGKGLGLARVGRISRIDKAWIITLLLLRTGSRIALLQE
jgi:hypothetical protein